ncbi:MAG: hypothetical protein V2A34_15860 [Lentisphaerota bacterium]
MSRTFKIFFILSGLLLLYISGVGVRYAVLATQYNAAGGSLPFTLESALQYRRIEHVFKSGRLPEEDPCVQYPDPLKVRETDTVGSEYVYAALAHLFPSAVNLPERVRWMELLWFCLGIPFMALWIGWWTRSYWAAALAGGFYACSISSVIRSTGQELSHENTALPFLVSHLALDALADRSASNRAFLLSTLASTVSLMLAMILWDLMQFYVLLWAVAMLYSMARGDLVREPRRMVKWLVQSAGLVFAGWLNPYLHAHSFLLSPAMLLVYGTGTGLIFQALWEGRGRWAALTPRWLMLARTGAGMLPLLAGLWLASSYGNSYGHFGELLWAKIRFLNQKPMDPGLLTFAQRILWVPALHSATWDLMIHLFPAILVLTLLATLLICLLNSRFDSKLYQLLFFYAASLITFCLFVRFHVFTTIFAAGFLGVFAAWALRRDWWFRVAVLLSLLAGLGFEADWVLKNPERWGRPNVYYAEVKGLIQHLKEDVAPAPVLANFGISASILAYGGCPVILHPKFESADIRERVKAYAEALFKGTEKQFRDWADDHGAQYYVYAMGEFASVAQDQQLRYMAGCMNPAETAPAKIFENAPDKAYYFKLVWGNRKYRLFRILTREDESFMARQMAEAEECFQKGDLDHAEKCAVEVLRLDEHHSEAMLMLKHIGALREQDFSYTGHESE